jgi:hypothetical protein
MYNQHSQDMRLGVTFWSHGSTDFPHADKDSLRIYGREKLISNRQYFPFAILGNKGIGARTGI